MKAKRIFKSAQVMTAAAVAMGMTVPLGAAPDIPTFDTSNPAFRKPNIDHDGYISRNEAAKLCSFDKSLA